jgi:hypothetical protein
MRMSHQLLTLVGLLAMEWELCSEDPFVFCYRIAREPVYIFLGRFSRPR